MSVSHTFSVSKMGLIIFLINQTLQPSYAADNADYNNPPLPKERYAPPMRSANKANLNVGQINVSVGGNICYQSPEAISLWRDNAQQPEKVIIKNTSTNQKVALLWQANKHALDWPVNKLPVNDSTSYLIKTQHIAEIIVLYQIPETLQDITSQNIWLNKQGCPLVKN